MFTKPRVASCVILLSLLLLPAPLLPPHRLAEVISSALGLNWKMAYLAAALGLHALLYGSLGLIAAAAVPPAQTRRGRLLQLLALPIVLVATAVIIRSVKLGFVPVLTNAAVPMGACAAGAAFGLLFRQQGWRVTLIGIAVALLSLTWIILPSRSSSLRGSTQACLQQLVKQAPSLPPDESRFGMLLQAVFAAPSSGPDVDNAIEKNRAALLALGIALGDERLARFVGFESGDALVQTASSLRSGTTLAGRNDWARHFSLSAGLVVLASPLASDASGLMKEQLDALTHGSGFSFGDLAADRAGVKFAKAATASKEAAQGMQKRLKGGFAVEDFFSLATDLPENLTVEQFRRDFGGVGDQRYRQKIREIEERLDRCPGLVVATAP